MVSECLKKIISLSRASKFFSARHHRFSMMKPYAAKDRNPKYFYSWLPFSHSKYSMFLVENIFSNRNASFKIYINGNNLERYTWSVPSYNEYHSLPREMGSFRLQFTQNITYIHWCMFRDVLVWLKAINF